jgi:hypothetical protein
VFVNIYQEQTILILVFNLVLMVVQLNATTTTSTAFRTYHEESDAGTTLGYDTGADTAQSTGFFNLIRFRKCE